MKRPCKFLTHREMLMGVPSDLFKTIKNKQMKELKILYLEDSPHDAGFAGGI